MTVGRALNELEAEGLLERRAGSGSYVKGVTIPQGRTFGLLIPQLGETEIFEPICQGMARVSRATHDELLWGAAARGVESPDQQALELCDYYIAEDVSGVFFAPLELSPEKDRINRRILDSFQRAAIPVILLDRDIYDYPQRGSCDLVGIDNRRAGDAVTTHLINQGCQRISFVAAPGSAPTVGQRLLGYIDAISRNDLPKMVSIGDIDNRETISRLFNTYRPDGFVCANDRTAGQLMVHLSELGVDVPSAVKIVGIDDVKYATLLHVPLTTLRQPCYDIGAAAVWAMIERIEHPTMPARDILLACQLIVRRSSADRCSEGSASMSL